MKILLWISTLLLVGNINVAVTVEEDLSLMLVQTLQNQLQTCMNQNAELVKRTCNENNTNSNGPSIPAKVAFHAGLSKAVQDLQHNYKLVFDKMYLNEGNAYDPHSGIFICPRDGIYVFHWTILTKAGQNFYTDFMVNEKVVGRSHPNAATVNRAASSTVVQRLKKGDKAWIEPYGSYNGQYAHEGWSFYSGYML